MKKKCKVTIKKRGIIKRKVEITSENCSIEQLSSILKKRDVAVNDINLIKTH